MEIKLVNKNKLGDMLVGFMAIVYDYAHKKNAVYGENREYFVTLEELDRLMYQFESINRVKLEAQLGVDDLSRH